MVYDVVKFMFYVINIFLIRVSINEFENDGLRLWILVIYSGYWYVVN